MSHNAPGLSVPKNIWGWDKIPLSYWFKNQKLPAAVCKRWERLTGDDTLWKRLDLGLASVPAGACWVINDDSSCTFSQSLYNVKSTIPRCPWNGPVEGLLYIAACSGDHGWKYFHFSDLKPGLEISQIRPELWVGDKRSFGQLFVDIQNHCHSIESNGSPCKAIDHSIVP